MSGLEPILALVASMYLARVGFLPFGDVIGVFHLSSKLKRSLGKSQEGRKDGRNSTSQRFLSPWAPRGRLVCSVETSCPAR